MPRKYSDIIDELTERIRRYYGAINIGGFNTLQAFIDLELFEGFRDTALLEQAFATLRNIFGRIEVTEVAMDVHLDEKLPRYGGRDYATGVTRWKNAQGGIRFFKEHWVRGERCWYTRNMTPVAYLAPKTLVSS